MRERRFAVLAVGVVIVVLLPVTAATGTAAAQSAPDCSTVEYDGEGTETEPYEVESVDQLQCIEEQSLGANYTLVSDIDASETSEWNGGKGFEPIGEFTGTFYGANHTITGLTIDRPNGDDIGLFGAVDENGTVKNTNLSGAEVTGSERVGSLIGQNEGVVKRSSASGTVTGVDEDARAVGGLVGGTGGTVEQSSADVNVDLTGYSADSQRSRGGDRTEAPSHPRYFGGLVGANSGTITKSYSTGSVSADFSLGGFVGLNDGIINESYVTGDVSGNSLVGGFAGLNIGRGRIEQSYATGDVNGNRASSFISWNGDGEPTVKRSYATGKVTGSKTAGFAYLSETSGGTVAESYWDVNATCQTRSSGGTGLTTSEMTGDNSSENMDGFDFNEAWVTTSGYPDLRWQEGVSNGEVREVECGTEGDEDGDSDGSDEDRGKNASSESTEPTPSFTVVAALVAFVAGMAVIAKRERK